MTELIWLALSAKPAGRTKQEPLSSVRHLTATGQYIISGGALNATQEYIGEQGTGIVFHSGGQNSTQFLYLGVGSGSVGAYSLSGVVELNVSIKLAIGNGTLNVSNGGQVYANNGYIGTDCGSGTTPVVAVGNDLMRINSSTTDTTSLVTVDGATMCMNNLYIGEFRNGTLNITNGGSVDVTDYLCIGECSNGTLNITNGSVVCSWGSSCIIGQYLGSTGLVTVDGAGSFFGGIPGDPQCLSVGYLGNGTLNITNGGLVDSLCSSCVIGQHLNSIGLVTVDGTGSFWMAGDNLSVGREGNGTLNITNGGTRLCR